jgi:hypothetical protein
MYNVRHWSLSLKVEPGKQCTQVSIAMGYQKNGQPRAGLYNDKYVRLLTDGGPGPIVIKGTEKETLEQVFDYTIGVDPGGIQCQLCAVRKEKPKDKSAEKEANDLAEELDLDTGDSGSTSLTAQANQLEGDLARWEEQERERQHQEAEERARLAAEEDQRQMERDMENARLAAQQQQMQAQSPPPQESESGWGTVLGAIGMGVATGLANNYIAEHGGTPIVGGIPPGLTSQPQASSGSGMSPGCDAILPQLQSQLETCISAAERQPGGCLKARAAYNCFRNAESMSASASCPEGVSSARQQQQQFQGQAASMCGQ